MAAESSRSAAAGAGGGGGPTAESYLGSVISLTSKCEIRYEGVLYNINTDEASIGLRNVRSFGTEGRKKDGPQIPASEKIYEYILFRGSDIKDLQVKSSPPPLVPSAPLHNDPAIIQSHYSRLASVSTSMPSAGSGPAGDLGSQTAQLGLPRSTFQGGMPLYQPGGNLGSWGSSPAAPPANVSGLGLPIYWQGYYGPSGGLPQMQQPPLLRPSQGFSIPETVQQTLQYPGMNNSLATASPDLPEFPPPLVPPVTSTLSLVSTSLPSTIAPTQVHLTPQTSSSLLPNQPLSTALPATSHVSNTPFVPPLTSSLESFASVSQSLPSAISTNPRTPSGLISSYQSSSHSVPAIVGSSNSGLFETSVPLVTPDQLLSPGPTTLSSSQSSQMSEQYKETKPKAASVQASLPESSVLAPAENKGPILPLPIQTDKKPYRTAMYNHQTNNHYTNRGRGRGRGNGYPRPVTRFTEDFDFTAMNEKFNKDEVWGDLGKLKSRSNGCYGETKEEDGDYAVQNDDAGSLKFDTKPVYVKDDFFDTISCNTLDNGSRNGRTRFSEQCKIDTETFGEFPRHRLNRGGGRGFRGAGGRGRGSYYGRGYGYVGRGRGNAFSNWGS